MKINFLYTIIIATIFGSLHIYTMDPELSLLICQQQLALLSKNKQQQQNNTDIPLQELTHTSKTNSVIPSNSTEITLKEEKEEYVVIPIHDNNSNQNINQKTPLKTAIAQCNNTSQNNQSTSETNGGKLLFAAGGCAGVITIIVYLAIIVSGHH